MNLASALASLAASALGMGGYGGYVWPAFAIAALVMGALLAQSLHSTRRNEAEASALRAERAAGRETAETGDGA